MYHRERRKMKYLFIFAALTFAQHAACKSIVATEDPAGPTDEILENNIIDFDEDYSLKFNKKYGSVPWHTNDKFNKDTYKYTVVKDHVLSRNDKSPKQIIEETTPSDNLGVIPLELLSTTENTLFSIIESTTDADLTVIPLSTTRRTVPVIEIKQTVTLPSSTQSTETSTDSFYITTENDDKASTTSENSETTTKKREVATQIKEIEALNEEIEQKTRFKFEVEATSTTTDVVAHMTTTEFKFEPKNITEISNNPENETKVQKSVTNINETNSKDISTVVIHNSVENNLKNSIKERTVEDEQTAKIKEFKTNLKAQNQTKFEEVLKTNSSKQIEIHSDWDLDSNEDVTSFSGLDTENQEVPEDYYDSKDVVPTTAPKTDALSVIFGLAGSVVESVVESVAERVVPKGIYDLFKRMQRQSEALEAERLRSREENGGLGQFGRGILKSISTGLSKPLSQLMAGAKDIGSLDSDRGFVSSLASGVTSVASAANSLADMFKDRVQAIYPGTVWCGDGHSAQARSNSELGLFFFTDTCCRQHDACKIYIKSGETKYGLTNTGLFTRSHCSCDAKFRECLRKTNSLVSAQIGLTYFNVLGPQCLRKAHPIVKCVRKTRITGQKCEEYELDYTKPKMWQWFDNETF